MDFGKASANQFYAGPRSMVATSVQADGTETTYELEATLPLFNPSEPVLNGVRWEGAEEEEPKPKRAPRTPRTRKATGTVE